MAENDMDRDSEKGLAEDLTADIAMSGVEWHKSFHVVTPCWK